MQVLKASELVAKAFQVSEYSRMSAFVHCCFEAEAASAAETRCTNKAAPHTLLQAQAGVVQAIAQCKVFVAEH